MESQDLKNVLKEEKNENEKMHKMYVFIKNRCS